MQVSSREKNILLLAVLVALAFVFFNVLPRVQAVYQSRQENIEGVELNIDREQRLVENTVLWQDRRVEVEAMLAEFEAQVFSGATIPIVEANIQRALSQYARDSGITVSSTRLAERIETEGWLLISQEMSFRTTNAGNTVTFLGRLEKSAPRLRVTDFSVSRSRNQYSGSITVVGFARSEGLSMATAATR
jgi:type II secretory pathway component PulM